MDGNHFKEKFKERSMTLLTAAFALVAGLAWNDAARSFIELLFPFTRQTVIAKLIYAGVVTVVAVIITMWFNRAQSKDQVKK